MNLEPSNFEPSNLEPSNLEPSKEIYQEIEQLIHSDASPVGIDAKKTHVLILHLLQKIDSRLDALEKKLEK